MRFNPSFNQVEIIKHNKRNPSKKIDLIDAIILQQLYLNISDWRGIEKIKYKNREFCWIAYKKILDDLPVLGYENYKMKDGIKVRTYDVIAKRIKTKLVKSDLLELYVKRNDNSKTFWFITPAGLKIAIPGKKEDITDLSNINEVQDKAMSKHDQTTRQNERQPPDKKDVSPPTNKTSNYIPINNLIKNKREVNSRAFLLSILKKLKEEFGSDYLNAIEYLYDNCSYRLIAYLDKHLTDIKEDDWYKFLLFYNLKVMEENIEIDASELMNRLGRFKVGWVKTEPKIIAQQKKWDKINRRN